MAILTDCIVKTVSHLADRDFCQKKKCIWGKHHTKATFLTGTY